jgi:hypothetical protein
MKNIIFEIKKSQKKTLWTQQEDNLLLSLVSQGGNRRSWLTISKKLGTKSAHQCLGRYRTIRPNIKKGAWSTADDTQLLLGYSKYGRKWNLIANFLQNRSSKQIRDRYTNYLDPCLKKCPFSLEEDLKLLQLHRKYGNKWAEIKKAFIDRSFDQLKNRFNSAIKKNVLLYEGIVNSPKVCNNEEEVQIGSTYHYDTNLGVATMKDGIDFLQNYDFNFETIFKGFEMSIESDFSDNHYSFAFDGVHCL